MRVFGITVVHPCVFRFILRLNDHLLTEDVFIAYDLDHRAFFAVLFQLYNGNVLVFPFGKHCLHDKYV
jgi:hypothetical protein